MIHGAGRDAVGLVQQVTTPIARVNGNVVDLRQDVMHGLFTLVMVVDLADCSLRAEQFRELVATIAEDTNLALTVDKYTAVPRSPDRKNLLLILVGRDKPGIIARISDQLRGYNVNLELTKMIARAGIFLMELHADITQASLPLENLMATLDQEMRAVGIRTMFQARDVFQKKKRVVCFEIASSFIDRPTLLALLRQTDVSAQELRSIYPPEDARRAAQNAARRLENLPAEVALRIAEAIQVTPATTELIETLKIMGYKVAVIANAFGFFTDILSRKAGLDACYGFEVPINDDSLRLTGELGTASDPLDKDRLIAELRNREQVSEDDITVISDAGVTEDETPGIRVALDMKLVLDYLNQKILSRDNLIGILGSFGIPRC